MRSTTRPRRRPAPRTSARSRGVSTGCATSRGGAGGSPPASRSRSRWRRSWPSPWVVPEWAPATDPAFMGIRALDVGTAAHPAHRPALHRRPVLRGRNAHVTTPGPTHFYLLAAPVRLLGGDVGMPLVTVLIVEAACCIAAWAVFRQLGPPAGVCWPWCSARSCSPPAPPRSSTRSAPASPGYPLLCAAVLCWCVLCGDLRLLAAHHRGGVVHRPAAPVGGPGRWWC